MKYLLKIAYDGTNYSGWQIQPNAVSIQQLIEEALETVLKEKIRLTGAGRTDAGVHALEQIAHFTTDPINERRLQLSLNGILPPDIRIKEIHSVPDTFHARFSARSKIYHYHIWLDETADPFLLRYRHHLRRKISLPLLQKATTYFVGKHDFRTFANTNSSAKTSIRTIKRIDIVEQPGGIRLEFEGDGFLYKMVRNITGTLLEVATGKRKLEEIERLLEGKDRRLAGIAAPAKGLFLVSIDYKE